MDGDFEAGLAAARAAWPDFAVPRDAFRARAGSGPALHYPDLYLACACARGDTGAIVALERMFGREMDAALRHMRLAPAERAEAVQELWIKLLTRDGARPPRIADYAGQGPLKAWLRVAAIRTALNLRRRSGRETPCDASRLSDVPCLSDSPELARIKAQCRPEFEASLRRAFSALARSDRNLVKQHYLDGVGIGQLAEAHRVHRVTIARRLQRARDDLSAAVRKHLRDELGASDGELDSMLRVVRSELGANLVRLLQTQA